VGLRRVGLTGRKSVGLDDSLSRIESGASKANTVYGNTRVESDITRSRDATGFYGGYCTCKENPVGRVYIYIRLIYIDLQVR
jgi:hypothetical protein